MNSAVLLSTAYLPPAWYFSRILSADRLILERHEHFVKQSYRNRCSIYGANGKLDLIVPLVHSEEHTSVYRKRISYVHPWQALHWKSICSAYRSSPYFEFFERDFEIFYERRWEFLFDYNLDLLKTILRLMKIDREITFTEQFEKIPVGVADLRQQIHPKKDFHRDAGFVVREYYQVFSARHGFIPNLSIIDLLFNEGLNAVKILGKKD